MSACSEAAPAVTADTARERRFATAGSGLAWFEWVGMSTHF
jgi:hypothetical protein